MVGEKKLLLFIMMITAVSQDNIGNDRSIMQSLLDSCFISYQIIGGNIRAEYAECGQGLF